MYNILGVASMKNYLKFVKNDKFDIRINSGSFVTFFSNDDNYLLNIFACLNKSSYLRIANKRANKIDDYYIRKNVSYVLNKDLNTFTSDTVESEIAYSLEYIYKDKKEINELIEEKSKLFKLDKYLNFSPNILGSSDKAKLKILSSIIFNPKVLVLDNILSELDYEDNLLITKILKQYVKDDNIVLNFTHNVDESLYGQRIIINDNKKVIIDGKTLSVLNEDKILKKLGIGLPFIVELNKYLLNYEIIEDYELNMNKLMEVIWK